MGTETKSKDAEIEFWTNVVPEHLDPMNVSILISTLADEIFEGALITDAMTNAGLQPSSRACWLAASAAVHVLLAHEAGLNVASNRAEDEGYRPDELPLTPSIADWLCECGHAKYCHYESLAVPGGYICNQPGCECEMFKEQKK